jgi:hypothetical protein
MAEDLGKDDIFELKSALQMLVAEMRDAANGTKDFSRAVGQQLATEENDRKEALKRAQAQKAADKATKDLTNSIKDFSVKQAALNKIFGENASVMTAVFDGLATRVKAIGKALMDGVQIIMDGVKNARNIGISAQEGVALEVGSMIESIRSIFSFDPNQIFNSEEIKNTTKAATEALGGFSAGLEVAPDKLLTFNQNLGKAGIFGAPTAETFRALALTGTTTAEGLESLRAATGRQSIQTGTLSNIINKNLTSINIFGTSMLKRALDFDRLGISLESLNKGAESYVTNLDGQIDALAQLGQLGTEIDFEKLTMLQEFGAPGEAQKYVASLVNAEDLRSSSYRALLGQIAGINIDEIIKIKGAGNFEKLEQQVTKQKDTTGAANESLTLFGQIVDVLTNNKLVMFAGSLVMAVGSLAAFILQLVISMKTLNAIRAGGPPPPGGGPPPPGGGPPPPGPPPGNLRAGVRTGGAVGVGAGIMSGVVTAMQGGSWKKIIIMTIAPILGGILGGALGGALVTGLAATGFGAPIAAAIGPGLIAAMSGVGASAAGLLASKLADDVMSAPTGYGDRTLLTPKGSLSLNNDDTFIAGTDLGGDKQSTESPAVSQLITKIDNLMDMLRNAETVIDIPGAPRQKVPRFQMVGVYSRNEME